MEACRWLLILLLLCGQNAMLSMVFPDSWRIQSPIDSNHCKVVMTSSSTNMTMDKLCSIEKTLYGENFHPSYFEYLANEQNNCHKQAYFMLSMNARYTVVTNGLLVSHRTLYDNKRFEVTLGDKSIMNISIPIEISTFDDRTLEMHHPYYNWTRAYTIFQRYPVIDDPPTVLSIRNIHNDSGDSLNGFLEISDWKVEYIPHPHKWDFTKHPLSTLVEDDNDPLDKCALLGTPHAIVLNRVSVDKSINNRLVSTSGESKPNTLPRVFCGIYTIKKYHDNVIAMRDTWGRKCTNFLAFSDVTDPSIPSMYLPHLGVESYHNIWQKVRSMVQYVYHHYREEYDYFLFGGDDMYYIMENLYAYLDSEEIRAARARGEALYLGREYYQEWAKVRYNTGGPGYLLDSEALKIFGSNMHLCNPDLISSMEDVTVGFCLDGMRKLRPYNTADARGNQRWHNFPPGYLLFPDEADLPYFKEVLACDIHMKFGEECCSQRSIAFHYIAKELMYDLHNYIYKCGGDVKQYYYEMMGANYYDNSTVLTLLQKLQTV